MKVLQLISSIGFFGAENAMQELSKALPSDKYHCYIGIIGNSNNLQLSFPEKNKSEIKVFSCSGKFDLKVILEIRRYIISNKIDIIHSHNYKSDLYSFLGTINTKIKRIATCHNWLGQNPKMKFYEFIDKLLLRRFDSVIAVSQSLKNELIKIGMQEGRINVVHNGIDIEKFITSGRQQGLKKSLGIQEEDKVIGTIGRLSPEKGHSYLIKEFAEVVNVLPRVKLLIVGDGPLRGKLEELVRKFQLESRVIFTGRRQDIPEILRVMDIFVLPSLVEAMPISLLEALAAKKPVIATNVGDVSRVIENGRTGILIEPESINGLSHAIRQLITEPDKARLLANNGYEEVKRKFSAQKMAQGYAAIYDNINKQKIIQVEIAGKGGICHYTYNLSCALAKHRKVVLVTGVNYELNSMPREFEVKGIFNRFKTNPFYILRLLAIFRDNNTKVIHFQLSQHPLFVFLLCVLVKFFSGKRIVVTAHNVLSHEKKRGERGIYRKIYNLADKVIIHAQANKIEMAQHFAVPEEKLVVIPHGNYSFFNEGNEDTGLPEKTSTILFFGYIREYKGLLHLIRALKLIKEKIPEVKLCIVGRAVEDFKVYREEIEKLGLQNNVELNLDYVPFEAVKGYFKRANIVALPYINIYQSGILQLAYAFGRPVVASSVGGLKEAVDDGKSGFLVAQGDVNSLADKIVTVLNNRTLQQEMSKYALNLARTKFSWDNIAEKTMELYDSLNKSDIINLPVLMYHCISPKQVGERYDVRECNFEEQIRYLYENGYKSLLPEDIFGHKVTGSSKYVMITFDDGNVTDFTIARPILNRYGFKGVFFITTSFIGKNGRMNWQQLQVLEEEGHSVQSHSHTHPLLNTLSQQDIIKEFSLSKSLLEEHLKIKVTCLSFPGGAYKKKTKDICRREGYSFIFTSQPGLNIINNAAPKFFYRNIIARNTAIAEFKSKVSLNSKSYIYFKLNNFAKQSLKRIIGSRLYQVIWNKYAKRVKV